MNKYLISLVSAAVLLAVACAPVQSLAASRPEKVAITGTNKIALQIHHRHHHHKRHRHHRWPHK